MDLIDIANFVFSVLVFFIALMVYGKVKKQENSMDGFVEACNYYKDTMIRAGKREKQFNNLEQAENKFHNRENKQNTENKEINKYQLFVGKVTEILGWERTRLLLEESKNTVDKIY